MRAPSLLAALALALAGCCQSPPPPPGCSHDTSCPLGEACFAGSCQSLTKVLQDLSVLIVPSGADLAPQQYPSVDATQPTVNLVLSAPQILEGSFTLPPSCLPDQALPIKLRFTGKPFIPLIDWTFEFETDFEGKLHAVLPAGESFDEWVVPSLPCAAPIAGSFLSLPGAVDVGVVLPFLSGSSVLTVLGNISLPGSTAPLAGASVTVKSAQGVSAGTILSASTITATGSPVGFVLPVPLGQLTAQPGADGGGCAPPPIADGCDGGPCPPLAPCVVLTLEVGPSAEQPLLPTIDVPITARVTAAPAALDGGTPLGPTLSLFGSDGLGLRLPLAPVGVAVAGTARAPDGTPLAAAQVKATGSLVSPPGSSPGCAQGCAFQLSTATLSDGSFSLALPPGDGYVLELVPQPGLGLARLHRD